MKLLKTASEDQQQEHKRLSMLVFDQKILWSFMFLLTGVVGVTVQYGFNSTCAVRGSTVTLPCSFTPLRSFKEDGKEIPLRIVRVRWCVNHAVCQGGTPSVFDSNSSNNDPRYQYLGDMKTNCTLQVRDVQMIDDATFRFRMEADNIKGHFTKLLEEITVSVVEETKMSIKSSSSNNTFSSGQSVSLQCSSGFCTVHQLEITWIKDGRNLSETGPALLLGPLTQEDSGNYTCVLKTNSETRSETFRLQVEEDNNSHLPLILGGVFGALLVVITLILVIIIIRKRAAMSHDDGGGETEQKPADNIYSSILPSAAVHTVTQRMETSQETEDVSYAAVQFRANKHNKKLEEMTDSTVYASVATRG
uniref:Ig-like domain-containing protein n=2 Tax=Iconisemion striatum TaxID=60296 RepID=A0A1A7X4J3_9TELE